MLQIELDRRELVLILKFKVLIEELLLDLDLVSWSYG